MCIYPQIHTYAVKGSVDKAFSVYSYGKFLMAESHVIQLLSKSTKINNKCSCTVGQCKRAPTSKILKNKLAYPPFIWNFRVFHIKMRNI